MDDVQRTELLAALDAATGPSRELDYAIAAAVGWPDAPYSKQHARRYTESMDAALTLVPVERMWFVGHMDPSDMRYAATISEIGNIGAASWRGVHATPALALCIAAIRARGEG